MHFQCLTDDRPRFQPCASRCWQHKSAEQCLKALFQTASFHREILKSYQWLVIFDDLFRFQFYFEILGLRLVLGEHYLETDIALFAQEPVEQREFEHLCRYKKMMKM